MTLNPVNPVLARAAVEEFFNNEDWRRRIDSHGWIIAMADPLTLIVTLKAYTPPEAPDTYTLRLNCKYYPSHPPDVIFVNPETFKYEVSKDKQHVANLQAPYCYTHVNYGYQSPYEFGPQLVCSSMALGYYFSGHNPTTEQKWQAGYHTIGSSIYTVHRALHSHHYHGRHNNQ